MRSTAARPSTPTRTPRRTGSPTGRCHRRPRTGTRSWAFSSSTGRTRAPPPTLMRPRSSSSARPSSTRASFAIGIRRSWPARREPRRPSPEFAMSAIAVIREGEGSEVLLVHGGASPEATWGELAPLRARWTLARVYRRGYPPNPPPPEGRQDFEVDAADLAPLLDARPHIVAHSYGALGTLIAATRAPAQVRSLTLIEPPLFYLVPGDPEVARLERMGDAVLTHGLDADPATLREFLRLAGAPGVDEGPLPDDVARGVRRAHGGRLPGEARPPLELIRDAGVPSLVASGDHAPGVERVCDALAKVLDAQRLVAPGAGHFVAEAPGFVDRLDEFLVSAA